MGQIEKIKIGNYLVNYYNENNGRFKVLFCHAFSGNYSNFLTYGAEKRTFDVIAPDFPGHGNTKNLVNEKDIVSNCSIFAEFIKEFLQKINDSKIVMAIGHSLGAIGALSALEDKRIKKAVLITPYNYWIEEDSFLNKLNHWLLPQNFEEAYQSELNLSINHSELYYRSILRRASLRVKNIETHNRKFQPLVASLWNKDNLNFFVKNLYRKNSSKILLIGGTEDQYVPLKNLKKISEEMKIPLKILHSGHIPFFDAKEKTLEIIEEEFLKVIT